MAEVSYSREDSCYYAQLVNAPGLSLLAEGETIDELLRAFALLVNAYVKAASDDGFGLVQPCNLVAAWAKCVFREICLASLKIRLFVPDLCLYG